ASPQERIMDALAEGVEDLVDQVRERIDSHYCRPARGSALKATAAALATKAVTVYLDGFAIACTVNILFAGLSCVTTPPRQTRCLPYTELKSDLSNKLSRAPKARNA
ncbi:MAG TPA: hypothetical protein VFZ34_30610, partial [Blastocatellia bacterium]|nr:hypothetical protein [Blastocatellia bacterium]